MHGALLQVGYIDKIACCQYVCSFSLFSNPVVYFGSFACELYFIQVLITIWKELEGKDEYTPFLTKSAESFNSSPSTEIHYRMPCYDMPAEVKETNDSNTGLANPVWEYSFSPNFNSSLNSIKDFSRFLVTPNSLRTFRFSDSKTVNSDAQCGTYDVRNNVYASDETIRHSLPPILDSRQGKFFHEQ